jgi:peroxiredoxin
MKKYFLLFLIIPATLFAQTKKTATKKKTAAVKSVSVKKESAAKAVKPVDGFIINGNIAGLADGTSVQLLNGSTGVPEQTTTSQKGKFSFTGKVASPDFKLIVFNSQPPYITVFADNSEISITGSKDAIDNAEIKGSASQNDFAAFTKTVKPYEELIAGKGRYEVQFMDEAASAMETFIKGHNSAYITPLAIYRYNQVTGDYAKLEEMYNSLVGDVKTTAMANYLSQQIAENKKAAYGMQVADFSQADTSGKNISLSNFKGKYVLVDFWASWCGPCRAENPNVVNTFTKFKDKNFTVLGVSLDRTKQPWLDAIAADGLTWTHVSDLQFWNNAVAQQFGIQSIPQNLLLDPEGKLVGKNLRGSALEYKLTKLLK